MGYTTWDSMLYSEEEFTTLYSKADGFNDDINRNCRIRDNGSSFAAFIDAGSDALLSEHSEFVTGLI